MRRCKYCQDVKNGSLIAVYESKKGARCSRCKRLMFSNELYPWEESLREEFQNFADSIIWQNDDGTEKYIAVGNMFDWWLEKLKTEKESSKKEGRAEVVKKIKKWVERNSSMGDIDRRDEFGKLQIEYLVPKEDIIKFLSTLTPQEDEESK